MQPSSLTGELPTLSVSEQLGPIEALAIEIAWQAGAMLAEKFGVDQLLEYKDNDQTDPVTRMDRDCQELVQRLIAEKFPTHGFLGEETTPGSDQIAPDFVWVVDPLDGTKNYINGFPIFACSIGVLYKGAPVAAATYIPWPGRNGLVAHARKGNGAFVGEKRAEVFKGKQPEHFKLGTLPGSFRSAFAVGDKMVKATGEARNSGSMAYDLALTASGVLQYTVMTQPKVWDVASGALLVTEAGGSILIGLHPKGWRYYLVGKLKWAPLVNFVPKWESGKTTMTDLWKWSHNLIAGGPGVAGFVSVNLSRKYPLKRRLARMLKTAIGRSS